MVCPFATVNPYGVRFLVGRDPTFFVAVKDIKFPCEPESNRAVRGCPLILTGSLIRAPDPIWLSW